MVAATYECNNQSGVFPSEWKKAELVLLPKVVKGKNMLEPSSYRPLCLHTSTRKLFEHLIATMTNEYIDDNHLLLNSQYGSRKGRSIIDAIDTAKEEIGNKKKRCLHALVTIDVCNAFNTVQC